MNYLFDVLLFLHMLGLAMTVGAGFSMRALRSATAELPAEERGAFMMRALAVSGVARWGFVLLLLSGIGMLAARFTTTMAMGGGMFHFKLTLVIIQLGLFGYMEMLTAKVKRAGGGPLAAKLPTLSTLLLGNALLIMVAAVAAFH